MLASYTLDETYEREAQSACNFLTNNATLRTPQGLFYVNHPVGSVRYASNLAFACYEVQDFFNSGVYRVSICAVCS